MHFCQNLCWVFQIRIKPYLLTFDVQLQLLQYVCDCAYLQNFWFIRPQRAWCYKRQEGQVQEVTLDIVSFTFIRIILWVTCSCVHCLDGVSLSAVLWMIKHLAAGRPDMFSWRIHRARPLARRSSVLSSLLVLESDLDAAAGGIIGLPCPAVFH